MSTKLTASSTTHQYQQPRFGILRSQESRKPKHGSNGTGDRGRGSCNSRAGRRARRRGRAGRAGAARTGRPGWRSRAGRQDRRDYRGDGDSGADGARRRDGGSEVPGGAAGCEARGDEGREGRLLVGLALAGCVLDRAADLGHVLLQAGDLGIVGRGVSKRTVIEVPMTDTRTGSIGIRRREVSLRRNLQRTAECR